MKTLPLHTKVKNKKNFLLYWSLHPLPASHFLNGILKLNLNFTRQKAGKEILMAILQLFTDCTMKLANTILFLINKFSVVIQGAHGTHRSCHSFKSHSHCATLTTLFHPVQCCQNTTHITLLFNNEKHSGTFQLQPPGGGFPFKKDRSSRQKFEKEPPITEILWLELFFNPKRYNSIQYILLYFFQLNKLGGTTKAPAVDIFRLNTPRGTKLVFQPLKVCQEPPSFLNGRSPGQQPPWARI